MQEKVRGETQLVVTIQELAKRQSEGKQIDAILLDFSRGVLKEGLKTNSSFKYKSCSLKF
jgi:hypothetical protein